MNLTAITNNLVVVTTFDAPCTVKRGNGSAGNKNVCISITAVVKVRSSWVPVTWQRTFNITNKQNFEIQEFQIIRAKRQVVFKIAICLHPTLFIKVR